MPKPLIQGDRVCKNQQFGKVDTIVERWAGNTCILRIIVVEWDDGTTSDEDEDQLDLILPGTGVNQAKSDQKLSVDPSPGQA